MSRGIFALLLVLGRPAPFLFAVQQDEVAIAQRVADISTLALAEYRGGLAAGKVVQPEEVEEARLFLVEAVRAADGLGPAARAAARPPLLRLQQGVEELASPDSLSAELGRLRDALAAAIGQPLDAAPAAAPSLARGVAVWNQRCAQCHGDLGGGNGPIASGMTPPPADLTDRTRLSGASVLDFFRTVNVGVAGTAMPAFGDQLAENDRWAVALFASRLRYSERAVAEGERAARTRCVSCLIATSDFAETYSLSDDSLAATVRAGTEGSLDDSTLAAMTAFARVAGAEEYLGLDRVLAARRVAQDSKALVWEAVQAYRDGAHQVARQRALDAYLVFERIETGVRARDAAAARGVEDAFGALRREVGRSDGDADPARLAQSVERALDQAVERLTTVGDPSVLFGQSLVIIVREGLEAILIIGALVAVLVKSGAPERRRDLGLGALVAGGASLITAALFATLLDVTPAHRETLEGATVLVAAAVLFWVSYWLISKIETRRWMEFVRSQVRQALASKRSWALAAVAFLAVYREGFETVLFYAALFTSAAGTPAATTAILAGLGAGAALLVIVYVAIERFGVRLPLRPFFAVTSALLYVMAFSFAGQGVAELQEAGVVSITPLDWLPSVPALGMFPTFQTALSQAVVALALAGALMWVFWLEPIGSRRQDA
jgi:high-affinity iron transporter